jgi:hypothetical protein
VLLPEKAYEIFLKSLDQKQKDWLYLVNIGVVNPFFKYNNKKLAPNKLGISCLRKMFLICKSLPKYFIKKISFLIA